MSKLPAKAGTATGVVLLVIFAGLLAWDISLATDGAEGNTISEVMAAAPAPAILIAGYIVGHFWPIRAVLRQIWAAPENSENHADLLDHDPEV